MFLVDVLWLREDGRTGEIMTVVKAESERRTDKGQ